MTVNAIQIVSRRYIRDFGLLPGFLLAIFLEIDFIYLKLPLPRLKRRGKRQLGFCFKSYFYQLLNQEDFMIFVQQVI